MSTHLKEKKYGATSGVTKNFNNLNVNQLLEDSDEDEDEDDEEFLALYNKASKKPVVTTNSGVANTVGSLITQKLASSGSIAKALPNKDVT